MMASTNTEELTDEELTGIASGVARGRINRAEWRGIVIVKRGQALATLSGGTEAGGRWHVGGSEASLEGIAAWLRAKADLYGVDP